MSFTQITPHSLLCIIFARGLFTAESGNKKSERKNAEKGAKIRLRLSTPYVLLAFYAIVILFLLLLFKTTIQLAGYWKNESK